MLARIADITHRKYDMNNIHSISTLLQIKNNLPTNITSSSLEFTKKVQESENKVSKIADKMLENFISDITQPPKQRVLKIKSSPKGVRSPIPASNGIRYTIGPTWNASVIAGKGIAFVPAHRPKLDLQAKLLGIEDAENMTSSELAVLITQKLIK